MSHFLSNGSLVNGLVPQLGVLWTAGEVWKGGLEGRTSPYPFFRWVPPLNWAPCSSAIFECLVTPLKWCTTSVSKQFLNCTICFKTVPALHNLDSNCSHLQPFHRHLGTDYHSTSYSASHHLSIHGILPMTFTCTRFKRLYSKRWFVRHLWFQLCVLFVVTAS